LTSALAAKRFGLLLELVPRVETVAVLTNPTFASSAIFVKDAQEAAARIGVRLIFLEATKETEFEPAFAAFVAQGAGALMLGADPFFNSRRSHLVALAARHNLPAIYEFREFAMAGGLMSYGTRLADTYHQVGIYAGRILKGEKPANLPVMQSATFEFVVNLKAARAQGLEIPPMLLARADDVIE
jgi:putative ABC transport system substrate-binding protein